MPSRLVERTRLSGSSAVRVLLVLWQNPVSRAIVPVGRFSVEGDEYRFAYVKNAADSGMRPLLGFPSFDEQYRSHRLPLLFAQRVLDPARPDLARIIAELGLARDATPWEQIVRTGGSRHGDTIQVMELPSVIGGTARARFFINGIRHIPGRPRVCEGSQFLCSKEEQDHALARVAVDSTLVLLREDDNPEDPDALLVVFEGVPLGYVPRFLSSDVRRLVRLAPGQLAVRCVEAGGPHVPAHMRLVVELECRAPAHFSFDPEGAWRPTAAP